MKLPKIIAIKKFIDMTDVRNSYTLTGFSTIFLEFKNENERDEFRKIYMNKRDNLINNSPNTEHKKGARIITETLLTEYRDRYLCAAHNRGGFLFQLEDLMSKIDKSCHNLAKYRLPIIKAMFDLVGVREFFVTSNDRSSSFELIELKPSTLEASARDEISLEKLIDIIESADPSDTDIETNLNYLKKFIITPSELNPDLEPDEQFSQLKIM